MERSTPKYFYMVDASSGVSCKLYVVLIRLPPMGHVKDIALGFIKFCRPFALPLSQE